MIQIDRWTTASSNCLGYAPEDGELVKYEDHFSVVDGLETLLRRAYTVIPDGVEVRAGIHRALNAEDEAEPPSTPSSSGE